MTGSEQSSVIILRIVWEPGRLTICSRTSRSDPRPCGISKDCDFARFVSSAVEAENFARYLARFPRAWILLFGQALRACRGGFRGRLALWGIWWNWPYCQFFSGFALVLWPVASHAACAGCEMQVLAMSRLTGCCRRSGL